MIPWFWLLVAFWGGGTIGFLVAGILTIAGEHRNAERLPGEVEKWLRAVSDD